MIRQAISCDICGTEKKQTNHWFVAQDRGAELRISGWNSRGRSSAGAKHLCGQTCLHKLVDEFMARTIAARPQTVAAEAVEPEARSENLRNEASRAESFEKIERNRTDGSLTGISGHAQPGPRVVAPQTPVVTMPPPVPAAPLVPAQQIQIDAPGVLSADEPPAYGARNWRAEAWERERERELRSAERRPDIVARRRVHS